jgi:hypothetical protein
MAGTVTNSKVLRQVVRAIHELDRASFSRPKSGSDHEDWDAARKRLLNII